jgi:hypothetical protein
MKIHKYPMKWHLKTNTSHYEPTMQHYHEDQDRKIQQTWYEILFIQFPIGWQLKTTAWLAKKSGEWQ